ncbi:hypothetical protein AgCh_026173 [Apium graveolens]
MASLQVQGDESVLLLISHSNMKSFAPEVRFSLQMTVEAVKEKLWKKCGTSVDSMCLELYDHSGTKISTLSDNMRPFGFYSPEDGHRLHIIDLDPSSVTSGGWLDDTSQVEKFTISEEAFDKLDGTYRKYKEKFAHQNHTNQVSKMSENYMEDLCTNIKYGYDSHQNYVCDVHYTSSQLEIDAKLNQGKKEGSLNLLARQKHLDEDSGLEFNMMNHWENMMAW